MAAGRGRRTAADQYAGPVALPFSRSEAKRVSIVTRLAVSLWRHSLRRRRNASAAGTPRRGDGVALRADGQGRRRHAARPDPARRPAYAENLFHLRRVRFSDDWRDEGEKRDGAIGQETREQGARGGNSHDTRDATTQPPGHHRPDSDQHQRARRIAVALAHRIANVAGRGGGGSAARQGRLALQMHRRPGAAAITLSAGGRACRGVWRPPYY